MDQLSFSPTLVFRVTNVSITSILAYRPLHFHAPGKLFFIVHLINTPTSINILPLWFQVTFHPGPPSNVNTVLYNGAAPIMYNVATRRLQGGCGRARERERCKDRSKVMLL